MALKTLGFTEAQLQSMSVLRFAGVVIRTAFYGALLAIGCFLLGWG